MRPIKSNQGFTLIELVIVIIILGILSAVAVPKFINLKSDAVLSTMDTLVGVIESADQLVYMKAVMSGVEDESSAVITVNGTDIDIVYGYPAATSSGIDAVVENNSFTYTSDASGSTNETDEYWYSRASIYDGQWIYWPSIYGEDAGALVCYIRYTEATSSNETPTVEFEDDECD